MYLIIGIAAVVVAFFAGIVLGYSMAVDYMRLEIDEVDLCPHDYDPDYCPECRH